MTIEMTTGKAAAIFVAALAFLALTWGYPAVGVALIFVAASVVLMPLFVRWVVEVTDDPPTERRKVLRVPYGRTELRQCSQCQTAYFPDPVTPDDPLCPRCLEEAIFRSIKFPKDAA